MSTGVSIIICCHNSAHRLPETLAHLAQQRRTEGITWEVLIVDNASTDGTAEVARELWPADAPAPLRVVDEPALGLSQARRRGLRDARYELLSFVDDDNWVCPDWVALTVEIMDAHPESGACGGMVTAVCEGAPPAWFSAVQGSYAVGSQAPAAGDVSEQPGYLWGAGLTIRRAAWETLASGGFRPLLAGRTGRSLLSGEDSELCLALRLAGWRLWYDPRLALQHYIPAGRLEWRYLRRLHEGFGASGAVLNPYRAQLQGTAPTRQQSWGWQSLATLRRILLRPWKTLRACCQPLEGDLDVLEIDKQFGFLREVLRSRGAHAADIRQLADALRANGRGADRS